MCVCHRGHYEVLSRCRLVDSCVLPGEKCLYIGLHVKTTFARLTQSQAILQSFRVFITFRSMRDTTFFHFLKLFLCKITVSFTMVIKRSPGGESCRWRAVNFEIHLCSSGMNCDCIWRSISIQYVQNRARRELWPRKWFLLGRNPWR